jgi:hypothetical protein
MSRPKMHADLLSEEAVCRQGQPESYMRARVRSPTGARWLVSAVFGRDGRSQAQRPETQEKANMR